MESVAEIGLFVWIGLIGKLCGLSGILKAVHSIRKVDTYGDCFDKWNILHSD